MFKNVLKDIVENVDGGVASVLMGFDGIAVDSYKKQDSLFSAEDIGMEYSVVLGQIKQATQMLEIGSAREVSIFAEHMITVIRVLSDEYFVAVVVVPKGNAGKARFLLRTRAEKLLENLT
jgi:predicted regulator of Ras-like GTPase activity (Roadblock/LC7/MglB family)